MKIEKVTIGKNKVTRIWMDYGDRGYWDYDEFTTCMNGTLTSVPVCVGSTYPEGQEYAVSIYGKNEAYSRKFTTYAEAHDWFRKVRFAKNVADALSL